MRLSLVAMVALVVAALVPVIAQAGIVNVDFNGIRGGDATGATYQGISPAGTGTFWNGVLVGDSGTGDNFNIAGGPFIADDGTTLTTVAFGINPVGGDNNGAPTAPNPNTNAAALFDDYLFNNSGNNATTTVSEFSITGLLPNSTVDLYFYTGQGLLPNLEVDGETQDTFTATGIFTVAFTRFYDNVPTVTGTITGRLNISSADVLSGITIDGPGVMIPEPTSLTLFGLGAIGMAVAARRRSRR